MQPLILAVTVTSLTAAVLPVNSFQFTTSFCSGLLTVTSAGGGPCGAGWWLLQPASQKLNATAISRSLPMRSRLADVMPFGFVRLNRRFNVGCRSRLGSMSDFFDG